MGSPARIKRSTRSSSCSGCCGIRRASKAGASLYPAEGSFHFTDLESSVPPDPVRRVCADARSRSRRVSDHRDPHLRVAAPFGLASCAAQAASLFQHAEGAVDLAAFLVAAKHVGNLGAGDPGPALLRRGPDLVGGGIAQRLPENPGGGPRTVGPDRETGPDMLQSDRVNGVEESESA